MEIIFLIKSFRNCKCKFNKVNVIVMLKYFYYLDSIVYYINKIVFVCNI